MKLFLYFTMTVFGFGYSQRVLKDCGADAECRIIQNCQPLLRKALKGNAAEKKEVRKSLCALKGKILKVCCPKSNASIRTLATTTPSTNTNEDNLLPKDCGKPSIDDRIVGGEIAPINSYPWMVAIAYKDPYDRIDFQCSASVISSRYLLTAAHCVSRNYLRSRSIAGLNIGDWNIAYPGIDCQHLPDNKQRCKSGPHVEAEIEKIIIHPSYSRRFKESDDIALIRINKELDFEGKHKHIIPICIAEENFKIKSLPEGMEAIATGWGFTENKTDSDILLTVKIPFANRSLCESNFKGYFSETQICAGGKKGEDTCSEDSGGPLIVPDPRGANFYQIGIVSLGSAHCGQKDFPAVYTDVSKYRNWIINNIRP